MTTSSHVLTLYTLKIQHIDQLEIFCFLGTNTRKSGIFDLSFNEQKKSTIFIEPSVSYHFQNTILIEMQILTPELSEMICVVNLVLAIFRLLKVKHDA